MLSSDCQAKYEKNMKKVTKNYINNADFLQALIDYKKKCDEAIALGKPEPIVSNYVGECFLKISEHLARKPNFISYSFKEEMISDGIENCVMYFRNFNPEKSKNPFAYFTQIVYYAFLRRIAREKKQLYLKYKATEQYGVLDEGEMYEDEQGNMRQFEMFENISEYIETYEVKRDEQLKKKKDKAKGLDIFFDNTNE
jgi:hypothetical protein